MWWQKNWKKCVYHNWPAIIDNFARSASDVISYWRWIDLRKLSADDDIISDPYRVKIFVWGLSILLEESWRPFNTEGEAYPQHVHRVGFGSSSFWLTVSMPLLVGNDVIINQQFPEINHSISSSWWCQMMIWWKICYNWRSIYYLWCKNFIWFVVLHNHVFLYPVGWANNRNGPSFQTLSVGSYPCNN